MGKFSELATVAALLAAMISTSAAGEEAQSMGDVVELGHEHWTPNRSVPPGMEIMVIFGHPARPGPFIFRARIPPGYRLPPHLHPDVRVVTVLKGTYYSAIGGTFDESRLESFPVGSFYSTNADTPHFAATRDEEVIIQEMGLGPGSGITYVDPKDDPRPR
jgi:hypothetical protein